MWWQGASASFSVTASGTAPLSYQWQFNGAGVTGATGTGLTLSSVQPTNAGSYTVVVTNTAGSVTSAVAVLTVLVPPAITAQPTNLTVVAGASAGFSVTASGTSPLSYQWQFNGAGVSGATGTSLTLSSVQPTNGGSYTVVVTNTAGSVTSAVAVLTVLVPPAITAQPTNLSVVEGANASFSVSASGTAPLSYQWQFNGAGVSGATGTSLTLSSVQPTNGGSYAVVVTNTAGSVTSAVAVLTVLVPPAITAQPTNLSVVEGASASFSVTASGTSPLSYQWQFNGADVAGRDRHKSDAEQRPADQRRQLHGGGDQHGGLSDQRGGGVDGAGAAGDHSPADQHERGGGCQRRFQRDGFRDRAAQLPMAV